MKSTWRNHPKLIRYLPKDDRIMCFVDESGEGHRTMLKKAFNNKDLHLPFSQRNELYILNGICISTKEHTKLAKSFLQIKKDIGDNGYYNYKKYGIRPIILHNHEMASKKPPFTEMKDSFIEKINMTIKKTKFVQITSGLNYYNYTIDRKYEDNKSSPLLMCLGLLVVNYAKYLNSINKKGIIIFEEETKEHNEMKLKYVKKILNKGNKTYAKDFFKNITAVYFRRKWTEKGKDDFITTAGLELADLTLSPMRRLYNPEFLLIERKLYNHPLYVNNGLNIIT